MKYTVEFPSAEIQSLRDALREVEEERAKLREQNALLCKIVGVTALPPSTSHHDSPNGEPYAA